jgi:2',3'-cyclic-nucleotide 2'-phosphodiesterase (5'-nucleotidase family)
VLATIVKAHTVKEVDGVRIGIFGLTTPYDLLEQPSPFVLVGDPDDPVTPLARIAAREIAALRSPSLPGGPVDLVVLVSHLGVSLDRALAEALPASSSASTSSSAGTTTSRSRSISTSLARPSSSRPASSTRRLASSNSCCRRGGSSRRRTGSSRWTRR